MGSYTASARCLPLFIMVLHARYSFKYFGQDQGVSAYTFIDMRHFLPYSLIISAAEHEAHYVIDGLMHNEVVKSDIHSTDTGGYSEILFGAMHLLGFAFAPRIKNFATCQFYRVNRTKVRKVSQRVLSLHGALNSEHIDFDSLENRPLFSVISYDENA
jgi:TnpA family transposase